MGYILIGFVAGVLSTLFAIGGWIFWETSTDERIEHDELLAFREYWRRHTQG